MGKLFQLSSNMKQRLSRISTFYRLLIGNSIVIILSATIGILLIRHFTLLGIPSLILLFSSIGVFLSLIANYWIVSSTFRPLKELRSALNQAENGKIVVTESLMGQLDPDIHKLVTTIQTMVIGLETRTLQLRALSERVINAQEEERIRIARNLHDDTAQALSMIIVKLEQLESMLPPEETVLTSRLADMRRLAINTLDDIRKIIWDLRPTILDDLGLAPAIRWYARFALGQSGISIDFDLAETMRLDSHLETLLFRITQEAVSNILRHANAKHVIIHLYQKKEQARLEIEDDGQGFDVDRVVGEAVFRKKIGLLGIQERVSLVSGEVNIESKPGRGTHLVICVPTFNCDALSNESIEKLKQDQAVLE
jgi:two-component system sensor histidine kinase UhpB